MYKLSIVDSATGATIHTMLFASAFCASKAEDGLWATMDAEKYHTRVDEYTPTTQDKEQ